MKKTISVLLITLCAAAYAAGSSYQNADKLRTPPKGSAERKAIMDALRANFKEQTSAQVTFVVHYLKAHNNWAWADVTPVDDKGKAVAEGGPSLLHYEQGEWKVMGFPDLPDDPNDPMPAEDASPRFIKAVLKKYAGMPSDIFPRQRK